MAMLTPSSTVVFRGATAFFATTFYDQNGNVAQPVGAVLNIAYNDGAGGGVDTAQVTMVGPVGQSVAWTAQWDSRGAGPGTVACSIHTTGGPPNAVEDFQFQLTANTANLLTF
jgi:hypothetical protein